MNCTDNERREYILQELRKKYPENKTLLDYSTPFQLLVAVILSAQCTDAMVNRITPELFRHYPDSHSMSEASIDHLEILIHSAGFFKVKARNLKKTSTILVEKHPGAVPREMNDLVALPGVGRKTANVVRAHLWNLPGIIVDTHFGRVMRRLGFSCHKDPDKLEKEVSRLFSDIDWIDLSMKANYLGRDLCKSRKPLCSLCSLLNCCPHGRDILDMEN